MHIKRCQCFLALPNSGQKRLSTRKDAVRLINIIEFDHITTEWLQLESYVNAAAGLEYLGIRIYESASNMTPGDNQRLVELYKRFRTGAVEGYRTIVFSAASNPCAEQNGGHGYVWRQPMKRIRGFEQIHLRIPPRGPFLGMYLTVLTSLE